MPTLCQLFCQKKEQPLYVEKKQHNIAVLYDIFLALGTHLAGLFAGLLAAEHDKIIVGNGLRANKTPFKIGMNNACALRRLGTFQKSPGSNFLWTAGKIGLQAKQLIPGTNNFRQSGFFQPQG